MQYGHTLVCGQKNGLKVTVGTLPMKKKAVRVYFGEFQGRVPENLIRMLQIATVTKPSTPKETLSANSRGTGRMHPSADQRQLGPYYHTIRSYIRRDV
jgi:hypothetical protein